MINISMLTFVAHGTTVQKKVRNIRNQLLPYVSEVMNGSIPLNQACRVVFNDSQFTYEGPIPTGIVFFRTNFNVLMMDLSTAIRIFAIGSELVDNPAYWQAVKKSSSTKRIEGDDAVINHILTTTYSRLMEI